MKLNAKPSPILDSALLIGRVLPGRTPYETASGFRPGDLKHKRKEVEVRVPYFVYDEYYKGFFEHEWDFRVEDKQNLAAQEGDTVLIQKLDEADVRPAESISLKAKEVEEWWLPPDPDQFKGKYVRKDVTHSLKDILYKLGDVQDPVTKDSVVSDRYRWQMERTAQLYGKSGCEFDYEKAPKRGWQKGKRDFTDRRTYKKWHKFGKDDEYGLVG